MRRQTILSGPIQRAGFTLLETMISVAILGLIGSMTILTITDSRSSFGATSRRTQLEAQVRRGIDRVASELLTAGDGQLVPNPTGNFGSSNMLFRQAIGLTGTAIDWSNQHRIAFEYDTNEIDDGVDNDGDGLVDEGNLVLTRNDGLPNEMRVTLCRGVSELFEGELANGIDDNGNGVIDEAGFNIFRDGDVLHVRLTVQDSLGQGVLTRTLETSTRLRN